MKKGLLLVLLILFSCQKDEILVIDQTPTYTMIFENDGVAINDGQYISFDIIETTQHQLIITTQDGSVLTKESFQPEVGLNSRKIFTRILPPNTYNLILIKGDTEINKVRIIVE